LKYPGVNGSIRLKCVIGWVGMDWILVTQVKKWQAIVSIEVEFWVKNFRELLTNTGITSFSRKTVQLR
jgi:hypothetical protein